MWKLSWASVIRLVLIWLVLRLMVDIFYHAHVASSILSIFFYIAGTISGIGFALTFERRKRSTRTRIVELLNTIRETYKS